MLEQDLEKLSRSDGTMGSEFKREFGIEEDEDVLTPTGRMAFFWVGGETATFPVEKLLPDRSVNSMDSGANSILS